MAGHNKWSKVKRGKAITDGRRSKVFSSLSRDLTLAAKAGGGDPDGNARLRTLILKAREANMPADNVDRAIQKGTGELPGIVYEAITYEGYGPGGVAFIVQATTDNKTRAAKDIRAAFAQDKVDEQVQAFDTAHTAGNSFAASAAKAGVTVRTVGPVSAQGQGQDGAPAQGTRLEGPDRAFDQS